MGSTRKTAREDTNRRLSGSSACDEALAGDMSETTAPVRRPLLKWRDEHTGAIAPGLAKRR